MKKLEQKSYSLKKEISDHHFTNTAKINPNISYQFSFNEFVINKIAELQLEIEFLKQKKDEKIPILKGCKASEQGGCFCTGECKKVIGYWENGVYTSLENNTLNQNTNELFNNKR